VPIRNEKSNDSDSKVVKVCRNRTAIKKEHKIVIIGDSHFRDYAMRVINHLNNKFEVSGLVKPGTSADI
jgi:hypothetical protein